jgi:two-component system OmpR family response regulator
LSRILLVDDDPDILETVRWALARDGFVVDVERDGADGLAAARRAPPDLAILDVMLPGLNGYELARFLKAEMRAGSLAPFPILMLTARRVSSSARVEFLTTWSSADAMLWKPFDLARLLAQVHALLPAASPAGGME